MKEANATCFQETVKARVEEGMRGQMGSEISQWHGHPVEPGPQHST